MIVNVNNLEFEANPSNSAVFRGNTMLNGMYTDLDDDYCFVPAELENFPILMDQARNEGIPIYELTTYDPEATPFVFMINALCRMFREEVEIVCGEV